MSTTTIPASRGRGGRPGRSRLSIDLPEQLHRRLRFAAVEHDVTMTDIVAHLIERALTEDEDGRETES